MRKIVDFMMTKFKTHNVFDVYGIPLKVNTSFLLISLFMLISSGNVLYTLLATIALAISLVAHEIGHCLAAKKFGFTTYDITLTILGGCASINIFRIMKPQEEIKVAFAGPRVSFIIAIASFVLTSLFMLVGSISPILSSVTSIPTAFFVISTLINVCLGAFNLVPAFPMDGGRIFRAWLAKKKPYIAATEYAIKIAKNISVVFAILGLISICAGNVGGITTILIACFVWIAGNAELDHAKAMFKHRP